MTEQSSLFTWVPPSSPAGPPQRHRAGAPAAPASSEATRLLANLKAFMAPVAADAAAVITDVRALAMARDLPDVFTERPGVSALTKAEVLAGLMRRGHTDESLLESRFTLFTAMGLVLPYLGKKHQQRYTLDPAGVVGLLVFERMAARGGVEEMLHLLDDTRALAEQADSTREEVLTRLVRCRQLLNIYAAMLARLVETAPLAELIDQHRHHDPTKVEEQVHALNRVVTARFPRDHELEDAAFALVEAELDYRARVFAAVERVLDQGGASLDFSVLTAEQYLSAALNADLGALSQVGQTLVIDGPMPWLDPGSVLEAVEEYAPKRRPVVRPPESHAVLDPDPIGTLQQRALKAAAERRLTADSRLQGDDEVDLTSFLRDAGWPAAAEVLVGLLALSHDHDEPYEVQMSQALLVDTGSRVTYLHPTHLRHTNRRPAPREQPATWHSSAHPAGTDR